MATLIKRSEYEKLKLAATHVKEIKDAIVICMSQPTIPFVESYIVINDEEWDAVMAEQLDWGRAIASLHDKV